MTVPLAPERWVLVSAPDPAPLLEQLATLRLENTALRPQNAALRDRALPSLLPAPQGG